jgi:rhodanese-related sulfurtransferase
MNQPGTISLDVRTPAEYASGHLPQAQNINIEGADFTTWIAAFDKNGLCRLLPQREPLKRGPGTDGCRRIRACLRPRWRDRGLAEHGRTHDDGRPLTLASPDETQPIPAPASGDDRPSRKVSHHNTAVEPQHSRVSRASVGEDLKW